MERKHICHLLPIITIVAVLMAIGFFTGPAPQAHATTIVVTPAVTPTDTDNDFTRIQIAVASATTGDIIDLQGTFDWMEPFALADYTASFASSASVDIRGVEIPGGVNNLTITSSTNNAHIKGAGDIPDVTLIYSAFMFADDGVAAPGNTNFTMEKLWIDDFEAGIVLGWNATGIFDGTIIQNNTFVLAGDDGNATDWIQNIAIYFWRGYNQTIQNNTVTFQADGTRMVGYGGAPKNGASFGFQNATSGGNAYNGLLITNNVFQVGLTSNMIEETYGIWENSHNDTAGTVLTLSNNQFLGRVGDDFDHAFMLSSQSDALSIDGNIFTGVDDVFFASKSQGHTVGDAYSFTNSVAASVGGADGIFLRNVTNDPTPIHITVNWNINNTVDTKTGIRGLNELSTQATEASRALGAASDIAAVFGQGAQTTTAVDDNWGSPNRFTDPDGIGSGADPVAYGFNTYTTIQAGIDAVTNSTVNVADGTYEEAVVVDAKTVTLKGESLAAIVKAPTSIPTCTTTSYDWHPVICIKNSSTATIDTLTIDGAGRGNANYKFMGVAFRNSGGAVKNSIIDNIEDTPFNGGQHGVGINLYNDDAASRALDVLNNDISDFQKNGMAITTGGSSILVVNIDDNDVQGKGTTTVTAQNGIQVYQSGGSLTGTITDNTVNGIGYDNTLDPTKWVATSILDFYADVDITGNTVTGAQVGVYFIEGSGDILNNDIDVAQVGNGGVWGVIATDPPDAVPSPFGDEDLLAATGDGPKAPNSTLTVVVSGNTVTFVGGSNTSAFGIEADAGYGVDDLNVTANSNTVSGFEVGIEIWQCQSGCDTGDFTSVTAKYNCLYNNTYGMRSNAGYITVDGESNWWGNASGPYNLTQNPAGTGNQVSDDIDFQPWIIDNCAGSSTTGNWQNTTTSAYDDLQGSLDAALYGQEIKFVGTGPIGGGATSNTAGVTINLNGGTFGPGSPFLTVNSADMTVIGPGTLDGNGSTDPAILVTTGGDNFILNGVEVREWANGVEVANSVTSFKLVNNWIHSNTGAGLQVDSTVSLGGVVTIQGNLFKVNGGNGVQNNGATANLNVEYNSWGDVAGPTGTLGDGVGGSVDYDPWTFAETYLDVDPTAGGDQYQRNVNESTSFDVNLNVEAANLYGLAFQFTYDPTYLTFNGPPTFSAPWSSSCFVIGMPPAGTFKYQCYLTGGPAWNGGTVATFNFTANGPALTGDGPWTTYFDISHLETNTSAGAVGGVKVFVNNAGFNAPTIPDRDITDANDGRIDITGIAQFTGFVDLQGRPNDSAAVMSVFSGSSKPGTAIAAATSASSGAYTTAYIGANLLTVGTTYYLYFDRPLYLPTTANAASVYAHSKLLSTRPTTPVNTFVLLGGDATDDNVVDINDGTCIGNQYGLPAAACGVGGLSSSDVNGDGTTNILDLVLFGGNYLLSASPWTP